ncbi:unnamed protein product [Tilletia controversa]|nr:unnamed protein product [Tilletia controversa]
MAPNRVALNPQHDFEAVDAAQARCLICANAPEMDIRKVDKHRITAAHLRNLKLEPRRLCVTSVLHQRFRDSRAVAPAAAAGALAEDRDVGPSHFDTPFNASDRPLVVDNANVFVKDNIRPAVILPSLATRSFDRDWNAMPDAGDRGREIPGWQFRESNLEEEAYFQAVQAALAAVPRTDEDGLREGPRQQWSWLGKHNKRQCGDADLFQESEEWTYQAATGDSVMLAKLASSVGAQGNRPCRMCDWGGNELFKHSAEGVRAAMKSGEVRETAKVIEELKAQLQLAVDDKAPALQERWTATGTKDSATTEACTILLEENDKLKGKVARAPGQPRERLSSQDVQARLQTLREALTAKHWHSSLHQIVGFGGPEYTAIDILHVASLGPGKYLAALTASSLDVSALDHLRVRLEALSTTAIMDASSYPAPTLLRRLRTLNGKEVKAFTQLVPFALSPLIEDKLVQKDLLEAWCAYARFSRLDPGIRGVHQRYGIIPALICLISQNDLQLAIRHLWKSWASLDPKSITHKLKLHMLAHIPRQVRLFGPLKNVATERYESYNFIQRQAAVHTNRSAPSKDIARRLEEQELVVHWSSGGSIWDDQTKRVSNPGSEIRKLLEDSKVKAIRAKWLSSDELRFTPNAVLPSKASKQVLCATEFADFNFEAEAVNLPVFAPATRFQPCAELTTQAGDTCAPGDFVSVHCKSIGTRREEFPYTIGRIQGIWTTSSEDIGHVVVRVELFVIRLKSKYGVAGLISQGDHAIHDGSGIIQLLNAQHDCLSGGCTVNPTGGRQRLEREDVDISIPAMHHRGQGRIQKYILNEFLHRSPPLQNANLAVNPSQLENLSLDDIVDCAMETMPRPRKRGQKAGRKRKSARSEQQLEEEEAAVATSDDFTTSTDGDE